MIDIAALKARRTTLHRERDIAKHVLADLASKQTEVRETTLRIDGAIMVLDELIASGEHVPAADSRHQPHGEAGPSEADPPGMTVERVGLDELGELWAWRVGDGEHDQTQYGTEQAARAAAWVHWRHTAQ